MKYAGKAEIGGHTFTVQSDENGTVIHDRDNTVAAMYGVGYRLPGGWQENQVWVCQGWSHFGKYLIANLADGYAQATGKQTSHVLNFKAFREALDRRNGKEE
jgi:hypothetical protein